MKRITLYIFISVSLLSYSQEEMVLPKIKQNTIGFCSYISIQSDDLNTNFLNTMLYGGFITNSMKDNWINSGDEDNRLNAEIINGFNYNFRNQNNSILYLQITDVNNLNSSFKDDLLKLTFHGNFDYQGDTLDFSETIIRIDRYQQYKLGYNFNLFTNNIKWNINTAISYLNGNHHAQLNIDYGSLYTGEEGTSLDINYDINTMMTDTSNLSPFAGNGKGIAMDFSLELLDVENNTFGIQIRDLGFIKWNTNSIINNTDSNFIFSGLEIDEFNNLPEFNDSILDISFIEKNSTFRSFIPAKITLSYNKLLNHNIFKSIWFATHSRWQPYYVKGGIDIDLFNRGLEESGYKSSLNVITNIDARLFYTAIGFIRGGFTDKTDLYFSISDKKGNFKLGTYHLNEFFNKEKSSASIYFTLTTRF